MSELKSAGNWNRAVGYAIAQSEKLWNERHEGQPRTEPPLAFLREWIPYYLFQQWNYRFPSEGSMWAERAEGTQ